MVKTAVALGVAAAALSYQPVRGPLRALTVPPDRLPAGCVVSPSARPVGDLGISTNPWTGADRPVVASIRERIDGSPRPPDGPPLSGREQASYRLHFADGIDLAYAAVYDDGPGARRVTVYAVQFAEGERPTLPESQRAFRDSQAIRVAKGRLVAVVFGQGPCFDAVAAYIRSLPD